MQDFTERRMSRVEASNFLNERGFAVAVATLSKYAVLGGGPRYSKFGRKPLYTESDLLDWVLTKTSGPNRHSSAE
ncbi:MAG: transcriptional regulator [Bradyrhizobium sp.]|nr:transcriptional regulator [Bradyrhizobium sp.]